MQNSTPWMLEGAIVGLYMSSQLVGKGKISSIDPDRVCHNVPLGPQRVLIVLEEAFDPNIEYANTELLVDMVGSFLVWERSEILLFQATTTSNEEHFIDDSAESNKDGFHDTRSNHFEMPQVKIPKAMWMGMIVKVIDEANLTFALATIQVFNPIIKLGDITLGDTHVGILIHEFLEGSNQEHLKYRDCLRAWPLERLIANDGKLLVFHKEEVLSQQEVTKNGRRSYVRQTRKRKAPSLSISKKDKALSSEDILLLSTKDCCSQNCCQHFRRDLVKTIRERYWSGTYAMRKQEQINAIINSLHLVDGEKIVVLEGIAVCLEAWRLIHRLGSSQFYETKKVVNVGVKISTHGNLGKRRMTERVSQAYMGMKGIIDECADHHPAKLRTVADHSRQVLRELPTNFTWETIRNKINAENVELGLAPISQPTMSLLRQKYFKEVVIHKKGNNFSKCTTCSELQQRKSRLSGGKEELESFKKDEEEHHQEHTQGRLLYHSWRHQSIHHPKEVLCIIHDKMDHCKTAIPRMPFCPKNLDGAQKLPITLTGILTHGHGPKAIAQYNVGVWTSDPNTTVGSLDSILRMLENPAPMIKSLLEGPDSTNLFQDLLFKRGPTLEIGVHKAFEEDTRFISTLGETPSSSYDVVHRPLPRIMKLQLDNCAGDNKNRFVMAYLSLLTAREVFEEVHLGFLMVGHTHEDVDAMFGHFSESLMHHPTYTLPDLMSLLMRARRPNPVPHFVQEVPDFKSYLEPYLLSGSDALVGHLKPRLFRFYVRHDKMPCLQYKMRSMDENWLPTEGVEMWKWTNDKCPNLPIGVPKRLPMMEIKMLDEVQEGLQKHLSFFRLIQSRSSEEANIHWKTLIEYWTRVLTTLKTEVVQYRLEDGDNLVHGFWPLSKWRDHVPTQYKNVACELEAQIDYVGPQRDKPREAFNPRADIIKNQFVLVRPDTADLDTYPVYLGKVVSHVTEGGMNEENQLEHVCKVEYWRPYMQRIRGQHECGRAERWLNCWSKSWEQDPGYEIKTISVNTVMWCFKPRKCAKSNFVKIAKCHATKALDNLKRCIEEEANMEL